MFRYPLVFGFLGCLVASSFAMADDINSHDHDRDRDRDDVHFQCEFRGVALRKTPSFCEAFGRFERRRRDHEGNNEGNNDRDHRRDEFLELRCDNRVIVNDGIIVQERGREDHDRDHDGDHDRNRDDNFADLRLYSTVPFTAAISVRDAFLDEIDRDGDRDGDRDRERGGFSEATLVAAIVDHVPSELFGRCQFRRDRDHDDHHHDGPPTAPSVVPPSGH